MGNADDGKGEEQTEHDCHRTNQSTALQQILTEFPGAFKDAAPSGHPAFRILKVMLDLLTGLIDKRILVESIAYLRPDALSSLSFSLTEKIILIL